MFWAIKAQREQRNGLSSQRNFTVPDMTTLVEERERERESTMHLQQPGALTHYFYSVAYTDDGVADKANVILGLLLYALLSSLRYCH